MNPFNSFSIIPNTGLNASINYIIFSFSMLFTISPNYLNNLFTIILRIFFHQPRNKYQSHVFYHSNTHLSIIFKKYHHIFFHLSKCKPLFRAYYYQASLQHIYVHQAIQTLPYIKFAFYFSRNFVISP